MNNIVAHFVKSKFPEFHYFREDRQNTPVNISLVKGLKKSVMKYYPDNDGIPSIVFEGIDYEWGYVSKKERDEEFDRISNNEFQK